MDERNTNGKEYTEGISIKKGKFATWLDNYWYHYKWLTVGIAFFLIVVIICTVQMCTKEKNDIIVVYAGRNQLSVAESEDICSVLEAVCPKDFDKNGKVSVALGAYCILSEEQIREVQKETDSEGNHAFVDNGYNSGQYETYYNYITTGESSVLLLDPWLYNELKGNDRLATLEETLGYTPDGVADEYGVRLGDTEMYDSYGVMKLLPEDTMICILRPYIVGKSSKEKYYVREQDMFESLIQTKED